VKKKKDDREEPIRWVCRYRLDGRANDCGKYEEPAERARCPYFPDCFDLIYKDDATRIEFERFYEEARKKRSISDPEEAQKPLDPLPVYYAIVIKCGFWNRAAFVGIARAGVCAASMNLSATAAVTHVIARRPSLRIGLNPSAQGTHLGDHTAWPYAPDSFGLFIRRLCLCLSGFRYLNGHGARASRIRWLPFAPNHIAKSFAYLSPARVSPLLAACHFGCVFNPTAEERRSKK
jgi:hypothetical protein